MGADAAEAPCHRIVVALGSNIAPEKNLPAAVALLARRCHLLAASRVYETRPVGTCRGENFLNAAVLVETALPPQRFKAEVLRPIEAALGRRRSADRNAPRTLDADITLVDQQVFDLDHRHIPDPDLLRHAHVAVPVADVAGATPHPETGEPLQALAQRLRRALDPAALRERPDLELAP